MDILNTNRTRLENLSLSKELDANLHMFCFDSHDQHLAKTIVVERNGVQRMTTYTYSTHLRISL